MNPASVNRTNGEYNICFQGSSLDVGNLGCCALTASFIKLVVDTRPNAMIYLLYANRTNGVQSLDVSGRTVEVNIVNYRLSPKARLSEHLFWILLLALVQRITPIRSVRNAIIQSNRWLRTLHNADFVGEIRGGDSFSDIYGLRRFLIGIIPCVITILMRKNLILLPQTYGPYSSILAKHAARFVMMRAAKLYSRDKDSIDVVRNLLGKKGEHKTVRFCPDLAFILESALPARPDIQPPLDRSNGVPLIGLNISTLLYIGGFTRKNMFGLKVDYKKFVRALLTTLMGRTKADVLLIPHEYFQFIIDGQKYTEIQLCEEIRYSIDKCYHDRIHLVMREYDQNHIKGIIGICDFFIGSRMHACIAALSQDIPTIGLAYSKKFRGVFQTVGVEPYVIDLRQKGPEEITETIINCFEQREAIRENLKFAIPEAQKRVWDVFKEILCETHN
jgi:polysaccharide pyruvyl transferase WcaK-like protein